MFIATLQLALIIAIPLVSIAFLAQLFFNRRCEQDNQEDGAIFWKRFNKNLEEHKLNN